MAVCLHQRPPRGRNRPGAHQRGFTMKGRHVGRVGTILAIVFTAAMSVLWGSDRDETTLTVQVSSADHELIEGYFTLGDNLTVMAKPGTEVHRFLARQRGRKIRIALADASAAAPARLER